MEKKGKAWEELWKRRKGRTEREDHGVLEGGKASHGMVKGKGSGSLKKKSIPWKEKGKCGKENIMEIKS